MTTLADRHSIVVGVDGSATALSAARWAARLADRMNAPLTLIYGVTDTAPLYYYGGGSGTVGYPDVTEQLWKAAETTVQTVHDAIRRDYPDLAVDAKAYPGAADIALVELSDRARMTVVGSHGDGTAGSLLLGSTTLRVADHAHGPVVVWRGDPDLPVDAGKPVLVGVDGTVAGQSALREGFEVASLLGVGVTALHARTGTDDTAQAATTLLNECVAGFTGSYPDVEVEQVVRVGNPATALLKQARTAQLVIVASHVRNRVIASVLGSTSQNLLHQMKIPLMICRGGR